MRVLITRPRPDAEALAAQLHALGHTTFVEPLIDIVLTNGSDLDLNGVQALLFTSANGARAAANRTRNRSLAVMAVGPATAAQARELGFSVVTESAGEGVTGLAHHIRTALKPQNGALLHATGTPTAGDLKASLAPFGFRVRTERLYDAKTVDDLSGALTAELSAGLIDAALFFSPRTAAQFVQLVEKADLAASCSTLAALALSDAVAKPLAALPFRQVLVAAHATTDALLTLFKSAGR